MSLLDQFKEKFVYMNKSRVPDGEGGSTITWTEGAEIEIALKHDKTIEAQKAEKEGTASTYTFLVDKDADIDYHDVLKRVRDGAIFRITSNAGESVTPGSSTLHLTSVTAERWKLT